MVEEVEWLIKEAVRAGADLDEIEALIIEPTRTDGGEHTALWPRTETLIAGRDEPIHDHFLPLNRSMAAVESP
jgi:hypothetical protein